MLVAEFVFGVVLEPVGEFVAEVLVAEDARWISIHTFQGEKGILTRLGGRTGSSRG